MSESEVIDKDDIFLDKVKSKLIPDLFKIVMEYAINIVGDMVYPIPEDFLTLGPVCIGDYDFTKYRRENISKYYI